MRELPEFRNVYAVLAEQFGGKGWITVGELAKYEHCDPRTARSRYNIPQGVKGIDIAVLASRKCKLAH